LSVSSLDTCDDADTSGFDMEAFMATYGGAEVRVYKKLRAEDSATAGVAYTRQQACFAEILASPEASASSLARDLVTLQMLQTQMDRREATSALRVHRDVALDACFKQMATDSAARTKRVRVALNRAKRLRVNAQGIKNKRLFFLYFAVDGEEMVQAYLHGKALFDPPRPRIRPDHSVDSAETCNGKTNFVCALVGNHSMHHAADTGEPQSSSAP
jgi:hypothetical protein